MAGFHPAYLIHGDDHGRIGERRSRLRAMAEAQSGGGGVELLEGDACTPEAVVGALTAMTFALGRRFVIADGVERWKAADVKPVAAALLGADRDEITVAFFAREEGRSSAPEALHKAVRAVGGVVAAEKTVKGKDLPRWVQEQARGLGLAVDTPGARALVSRVGERQQRLLRELEKLALEFDPGTRIDAEAIELSCASSSERKLWTLADSLVAGDARTATRALLELRTQGERLPGLLYGMVRRLRDAHQIAEALAAGQAPATIKQGLRMPPFAADRLIADVRRRDAATFRRALEIMADLELQTRGGGDGALSEETAAVRALMAIAS